MRRFLAVASLMSTLLFAACSDCGGACLPTSEPGSAASARAATAPPVELQVLGAASLKSALDRAKTAYEAAHPGTTLTISTDSSAALETQIEQGAPADVFLSADTANPQKLFDGGLASGAPVVFATNLLTIIVPTGNPARINAPADIGKSGVRVIAAGPEVPITKYATKLVANIAATTADASAFQAGVREEHRDERGEREGDRRPDRARPGRRRDRLPDRRQGVEQGPGDRRARGRERPRELRRGRRQGLRERGRGRRRSSTGSPAPTARRSSRAWASCPRARDRDGDAAARPGVGARRDRASDPGIHLRDLSRPARAHA